MNDKLRRMTDGIGRGTRRDGSPPVAGGRRHDDPQPMVELVELVSGSGELTLEGAEYLLGDNRYTAPPIDDGPADNWGGW